MRLWILWIGTGCVAEDSYKVWFNVSRRQDREKLVKELKEHARKLEKIEKSFEKYSENVQNSVS